MRKLLPLLFALMLVNINVDAQTNGSLTKEQILAMSMEELSELPLEELMEAVETLGVSSVDELFALIMNKNVSSASKSEETAFTSPLSSTVITKAEMRSYGVTTIEEAFRLIPGVIVIEKANGVYQIIIRGLNNIPDNNLMLYTETSNILVMVDGRICQDYSCGAVSLEQLPIGIEDVERIEVVRGASSALYGPNAVQGVINIITEKPSSESATVQGSLQIGNQNTAVGDIAFRYSPSAKLGFGLTANLQSRERDTDKLYINPYNGLVYLTGGVNPYLMNSDGTPVLDAEGNPQLNMSPSAGGWYTKEEIQNNIKQAYTDGKLYNIVEPETPVDAMFPDSRMARKTMGLNGYMTFSPNENVRLDMSCGYNSSNVTSTGYLSDYFSFNQRLFKGGYANILGSVYGLSLNASFNKFSGVYSYGTPGMHVYPEIFQGNVSYDFRPIENLSIRPELSYFHYYAKDADHSYFSYDINKDGVAETYELSGYFNNDASNSDLGASVRLDYKTNNKWRFIGAFRSDKTELPDKWNNSWQVAISKEIDQRNFIRVSYGRAMRSAVMMNGKSSYNWKRTTLLAPDYLEFWGSEDAKLQYSDAIELGYRWRPTQKLLLDAEAYYSYSSDYGALQAKEAMLTLRTTDLVALINMLPVIDPTNQAELAKMFGLIGNSLGTKAYIQYKNVPYKVHQGGLSLNMDYIISSKLIAKLNLNVQKTVINDYYEYHQTEGLSLQLATAVQGFLGASGTGLDGVAGSLFTDLLTRMDGIKANSESVDAANIAIGQFIVQTTSFSPVNLYSPEMKAELLSNPAFLEAVDKGQSWKAPDGNMYHARSLYFGLNYNIFKDSKYDTYYFGSEAVKPYELEDGRKHKDTPQIYGMLGLMYKPISKFNVSAFANFISKRNLTSDALAAPVKMCPRFTMNLKVGYEPIDGCEVFFNAHNLFNNHKRELANADNIGGIYTFGFNFSL